MNSDIYRFRRLALVFLVGALCAIVGTACDVALESGGAGATDRNTLRTVTVTLKAQFGAEVASKTRAALAKELCPASPTTTDTPVYQGAQDCDGDGGIIRYITPSAYKVAFKRLAFENADGDLVDVIADTGTLADAQVLDLTSAITLSDLDVPVGEPGHFHPGRRPGVDPRRRLRCNFGDLHLRRAGRLVLRGFR